MYWLRIIPIFIIGLMVSGCSKYPVSGHVDMNSSTKNNKIYLVKPQHFRSVVSSFEGSVIDSTDINQDGSFHFNKMPDTNDKTLYLLTIQEKNEKYPTKLENDDFTRSNYIPFIYQKNKTVIIKSSADNLLQNSDIQGNTEENDFINSLIKVKTEAYNMTKNLDQHFNEETHLDDEKTRYLSQKLLIANVENNNDVLINALALRWISPNSDYERIPELVKPICQKLQKSSPNHPWTAEICQLAARLPHAPGEKFPDFAMPMMAKDTMSLYSIMGTKLTLIDMWASWCAPCRKENKNILVPLWDKYHNNGFQIIGYALDSSDKAWENATTKDGANRWLHASHLQGDESPLFEKIKITTIPANYLVDANGIILAKNLHGEDLTKWVDAYMK
jgi:thiol-disulfide isomerase/thioredoxin